jgi:hypothetical protein
VFAGCVSYAAQAIQRIRLLRYLLPFHCKKKQQPFGTYSSSEPLSVSALSPTHGLEGGGAKVHAASNAKAPCPCNQRESRGRFSGFPECVGTLLFL